jgi:nitrate reductase NapE component
MRQSGVLSGGASTFHAGHVTLAVIPFCLAYILGMAFVVALPELVVWLPNLVFGPGK